jgi:hypothetical protein
MSVAVVLDGVQRDAVYQFVLIDLAQLGGIAAVAKSGDLDCVWRLRQRFEGDLWVLDEIGWEERGDRELYTVALPAEVLRAVFGRLQEQATQVIGESMSEFADRVLKAAFRVAETSAQVLERLPEGVARG